MKIYLIYFAALVLHGCSSTNKTFKVDANTNNSFLQDLDQKQKDGIDFFAKGSSPSSWTLEIEFNKAIRLKSLDGSNIIASSVKPETFKEQNLIRLTTQTEKGQMIINIFEENCSEADLSGLKNLKVEILLNGKTYTGCGQFLFSKELNGKWVLQQIKGETLQAAQFAKGLPELEWKPLESSLSGHDGCNRLFGEAAIWGSIIKFGAVASTKMYCNANKELNLSETLNGNMLSYKIVNGQLMIYLPDDSIAIFSKK